MDVLLSCIEDGQSLSEWIVFLTGLIYVYLAARNNPWCWVWGIISCALLAYISLTQYLLYADAVLQMIYVMMGIWGLIRWKSGTKDLNRPIRSLSLYAHIYIGIVAIPLAIFSGYILHQYSAAFAGFVDSMTTIFGIIATGMLIYKIKENWLYWIVIDLVMVILYLLRGGCLAALLYLVFAGMAIYGWKSWSKISDQAL